MATRTWQAAIQLWKTWESDGVVQLEVVRLGHAAQARDLEPALAHDLAFACARDWVAAVHLCLERVGAAFAQFQEVGSGHQHRQVRVGTSVSNPAMKGASVRQKVAEVAVVYSEEKAGPGQRAKHGSKVADCQASSPTSGRHRGDQSP